MAEDKIIANLTEVSSDSYRNYGEFSRQAIHIYDENNKEYAANGWIDGNSNNLGTPLNAHNLNAMLDMLVSLRKVVGGTDDIDQIPVEIEMDDRKVLISPKEGEGLVGAVRLLRSAFNSWVPGGDVSGSLLTHTFASIEDAVDALPRLKPGELVSIIDIENYNLESSVFIVGEYIDTYDLPRKILIDQCYVAPLSGYLEEDSDIDDIIKKSCSIRDQGNYVDFPTYTTRISINPTVIDNAVRNRAEVDGSKIPDNIPNIMSKTDIDFIFDQPKHAITYELIRKVINGEEVPNIDAEFDIPDSVAENILSDIEVPEHSSNVDIANDIIDSIVGGSYNE